MSDEPFVRFARFIVLATAITTVAGIVVPLVAIATGAYPLVPVDAETVLHLMILFLPQAFAVALPIAVSIALFLVCRRTQAVRRMLIAASVVTLGGALVTTVLSVCVVPVTNAGYRTLAFGDAGGRLVDGRRLNEPGGPGVRSQMQQRWTLPVSMLVFAAFAIAASKAGHRRHHELPHAGFRQAATPVLGPPSGSPRRNHRGGRR